MSRKSFFWNVLLVASSIAALVSLFTTSLGLEQYITKPLAWLLSFAVQVGLFGMAWLIGSSAHGLRGLVILLYCLTMPFSVVFSYVTLQSEFAEKIKPEESQRELFDILRGHVSHTGAEISQGVGAASDLVLRLGNWLKTEREVGWSIETCEEASHCYLTKVCGEIQGRIASWERKSGTTYAQGPGMQLIFGLLQGEVESAQQLESRLRSFQESWSDSGVLGPTLDNRQRLTLYDSALSRMPEKDLEAALCRAVEIPQSPSYEDFARDDALSEEQPVYAFEDLMQLTNPAHSIERGDYPTVFALMLALFVDLFVLLVAIGAALLGSGDETASISQEAEPFMPRWDNDVRDFVKIWIQGSIPKVPEGQLDPDQFLEGVIESTGFDAYGRSLFKPKGREQLRFAHWLLRSEAATRDSRGEAGGQAHTVFELADWVFPALTRFANEPEEDPVEPEVGEHEASSEVEEISLDSRDMTDLDDFAAWEGEEGEDVIDI